MFHSRFKTKAQLQLEELTELRKFHHLPEMPREPGGPVDGAGLEVVPVEGV